MPLPSKKTSATQDQLALWLSRYLPHGLSDLLINLNARDGGEPVLCLHLDLENFSAADTAKEIFEAIHGDAELRGGRSSYKIHACAERGVEIASTVISIETGTPGVDPFQGMSPENNFLAKGFEGLLSRYDRVFVALERQNDRLIKQNETLHDKTIAHLEATEKALSLHSERELDRLRTESEIKRNDQSFEAIVKIVTTFGPAVAAEKLGLDPKVIAKMMASMGATAPAPSAQAEPTGLAGVIAKIPDTDLVKILTDLPEEAMNKIMAAVPAQHHASLFDALSKLDKDADKEEGKKS